MTAREHINESRLLLSQLEWRRDARLAEMHSALARHDVAAACHAEWRAEQAEGSAVLVRAQLAAHKRAKLERAVFFLKLAAGLMAAAGVCVAITLL